MTKNDILEVTPVGRFSIVEHRNDQVEVVDQNDTRVALFDSWNAIESRSRDRSRWLLIWGSGPGPGRPQ